jgi:nucleotide-binding universal stress UspA family protein
MIRDIVVKLGLDPAADYAAAYAISLAAAFEAHVTGIALAYEPDIMPDPSGQGSRRFLRVREENEERASAAAAQFEKKAADAGVAVAARQA